MPDINLTALTDPQILALYGRVKLNIMLCELFNKTKLNTEIYDFRDNLSRAISERGLDRNTEKHSD